MIGRRGFDGCTQMDYMLASIQLAPRIAAQALTLETVRDPTDHRPILLDLLTHSRRRVNKRQCIPPSKPKFLGWRLDAEICEKTTTPQQVIVIIFSKNWSWAKFLGNSRTTGDEN